MSREQIGMRNIFVINQSVVLTQHLQIALFFLLFDEQILLAIVCIYERQNLWNKLTCRVCGEENRLEGERK
jgi:arginine exporter protein ArgO